MNTLLVSERSYLTDAVIRALYAGGHEVSEIWTEYKRDRMFRRSSLRFVTDMPRCVGTQVQKHDIKVLKIEASQRKDLSSLLTEIESVDMLICAGSHIIFPKNFLDHFKGKAFNLHTSLLPRYRGPRPRFAMIFDGTLDEFSGVTLHCLSPGIDEGDVIAQRHVPRSPHRNVMAWDLAMADAAGEMLRDELNAFLKNELVATPQDPTQANYDSLSADETFITAKWSFEKLTAFLRQAYGIYARTLAKVPTTNGSHLRIAVCGSPLRLGDPTGAPTTISRGKVDMDILDARVRLKRETRLIRMANKVDRYRTILTGK